jgi:hypothetical protein
MSSWCLLDFYIILTLFWCLMVEKLRYKHSIDGYKISIWIVLFGREVLQELIGSVLIQQVVDSLISCQIKNLELHWIKSWWLNICCKLFFYWLWKQYIKPKFSRPPELQFSPKRLALSINVLFFSAILWSEPTTTNIFIPKSAWSLTGYWIGPSVSRRESRSGSWQEKRETMHRYSCNCMSRRSWNG